MTDCLTNGTHEAPGALHAAFPLIGETPDMGAALAATWFECDPCTDRHRSVAARRHGLLSQALFLWLATTSVARHDKGAPAAATADGMLDIYPADLSFSGPTRRLLGQIELTTEMSPEGRQANRWDPVAVDKQVEDLAPGQRKRVWTDISLVLTGWLIGFSQALADDQAGEYPRH